MSPRRIFMRTGLKEHIIADTYGQLRINPLKLSQSHLVRNISPDNKLRIHTVGHQHFCALFRLVAHFIVRIIRMQPITGKYPLSANNAEPTSHGREAPPPTCSVPVCNDDSISSSTAALTWRTQISPFRPRHLLNIGLCASKYRLAYSCNERAPGIWVFLRRSWISGMATESWARRSARVWERIPCAIIEGRLAIAVM